MVHVEGRSGLVRLLTPGQDKKLRGYSNIVAAVTLILTRLPVESAWCGSPLYPCQAALCYLYNLFQGQGDSLARNMRSWGIQLAEPDSVDSCLGRAIPERNTTVHSVARTLQAHMAVLWLGEIIWT